MVTLDIADNCSLLLKLNINSLLYRIRCNYGARSFNAAGILLSIENRIKIDDVETGG